MAIEIKIKKTIPWFLITMAVIISAFSLAIAYFLFFQTPPLIEHFLPIEGAEDTKLEQLRKLALHPSVITADPVFQTLQDSRVVLEPEAIGRENPYLPFPTSTPVATTTQP